MNNINVAYIAANLMSVINSNGIPFFVGEVVRHQNKNAGTASIIGFTLDSGLGDIQVQTDKGYCTVDFLEKELETT